MLSERRLVLHAGMPKTGTSALQVAFVRNRAELERLGVHYPSAPSDRSAMRGEVVTGNATFARAFLLGRNPTESAGALDQLVQTADESSHPVTLYSTEFAYFTEAEPLSDLRQRLNHVGIELEVGMFVRNALPLTMSAYTQRVKRARYTGSLTDFIDEHQGPIFKLRDRLSTFLSVLGRDRVTVLHYESHRHDLLTAFAAEVLGVRSELSTSIATVNRALDAREVEYMRYVNSLCDSDEVANAVGQVITRQPAAGNGDPLLASAEDLAKLRELCEDTVSWVNSEFFNGTETLCIAEPAARLSEETSSGTATITDDERRLLEAAVSLAVENCSVKAANIRTLSRLESLGERAARTTKQQNRAQAQNKKLESTIARHEQRHSQAERKLARIRRRAERAEAQIESMKATFLWRMSSRVRRLRRRA